MLQTYSVSKDSINREKDLNTTRPTSGHQIIPNLDKGKKSRTTVNQINLKNTPIYFMRKYGLSESAQNI